MPNIASDLPESRTIFTADPPGGPEALQPETRPIGAPGPGEIVIEAAACGVNKPDTIERMGFYPPPPGAPPGLGLEAAGRVAAIGDGVKGFELGEEVCALVSGGGYSDYVTAKAGAVLPVPSGLSLIEAAGLPETVFTVWANVFEGGALQPGETFLVHGGTSGIGVTAIQMAKAHGARVFATAGSDEKCRAAEALGAERCINYREADFETELAEAGGIDLVLDMVGGPYVQKNINLLNPGGRHVSIAFLQGSQVEIDLMRVMLKRLTLTGSTLRARPDEEKARIAAAVRDTVWPWIEQGAVRPVIDRVIPLADVREAHERLDAGGHVGKVILSV